MIPALDVDTIYAVPGRLSRRGLRPRGLRPFRPRRAGARPRALARDRRSASASPRAGHDRHRRQVHASARQLQIAGRGDDPWRHRQQRPGQARLDRFRGVRGRERGGPPARRRARHSGAGRLRRARHRGHDQGGAICPRAPGAVFRHLLWHADGGDRGGARSRRFAGRGLDRVRPVRAPGRSG